MDGENTVNDITVRPLHMKIQNIHEKPSKYHLIIGEHSNYGMRYATNYKLYSKKAPYKSMGNLMNMCHILNKSAA